MSSLLGGVGSLYKALVGAPTLVQFRHPFGETLVQFDAMMSESYGQDAKPTEFPVEDGSTIADNIVRSPLSIDFVGIVTDTPIGGVDGLIQEAATVAATATLPPIGVIAAATAYAAWQVHTGAQSRSLSAYQQLVKLQLGNIESTPPIPPEPFDVVTKFGTFGNMMITKLSVPRDASTGNALIFQVSVTQINVVIPQNVSAVNVEIPALAAAREEAGEQQSSDAAFAKRRWRQGEITEENLKNTLTGGGP